MHPDCLILYVNNPLESAGFYRTLLGREPLGPVNTTAMGREDPPPGANQGAARRSH